jgi:hypothetical protein
VKGLKRLLARLDAWTRLTEPDLLPGSRRAALRAILAESDKPAQARAGLDGILIEAIRATQGPDWAEEARRNLILRGIEEELARRTITDPETSLTDHQR